MSCTGLKKDRSASISRLGRVSFGASPEVVSLSQRLAFSLGNVGLLRTGDVPQIFESKLEADSHREAM